MDVSLAASKNQLRQLLEDVAFTRQYGIRLHAVANGSSHCMFHFRRPLNARVGW